MKKIIVLCFCVCLVFAVVGLAASSFAEVRRDAAIGLIAEKVCLKMEPPLESFPEAERYEVLSNALAWKGIDNFLGSDPNDALTIGDMKEIFDGATSGVELVYEDERAKCPVEVAAIFSKDMNEPISLEDFGKVADCFPYCDLATAETYIAPPAVFTPLGPPERPEEPASEL